jgi:transcriptional regulator
VPYTLDDAGLRGLLDDLSASQESRLPKTPWTTDKMPPELVDKMCKSIVGFDLPITELQSKWKFNQNRGADDRTGVVAALEELGGDSNLAVAATMRMLDQ